MLTDGAPAGLASTEPNKDRCPARGGGSCARWRHTVLPCGRVREADHRRNVMSARGCSATPVPTLDIAQ